MPLPIPGKMIGRLWPGQLEARSNADGDLLIARFFGWAYNLVTLRGGFGFSGYHRRWDRFNYRGKVVAQRDTGGL
jgi:hypothetical protein